MSSHEDSAGEFCCAEFIFSMKLLGFMSKALINRVGQSSNILPLTCSALTSLRSVNMESRGQYFLY